MFAGILSCLAILITGSIIILNSRAIDFSSVMYVCRLSIPAGIVAGILGYLIGKIFETSHLNPNSKSKNNKGSKDPDLLIDDLLLNDLKK